MGRRLAIALAGLLAVALLVVGAVALLGRDGSDGDAAGPGPTGTATPGPTGTATATGESRAVDLYLAVGDSLAAGYQPDLPGDHTDREGGYAGVVRDALTAPGGGHPELVNTGCPGETAESFLTGGRCEYPEGSQVAAAEQVLAGRADEGAGVLVTVQLGANDVQRCVRLDRQQASVDEACVTAGLQQVGTALPEALTRLKAAAPQAEVVVLDYYNPFVVAALLGGTFEPLAARSQQAQTELNALIDRTAQESGDAVARVGAAFAAADLPPTTGASGATGTSTTRVPLGPICSWTWMCADPPDIHATTEGYRVMADQVLAARGEGGAGPG